ncbi:hypothetical protein SAMN05880590_102578 [Rhizobium sp. RU35A]|nr:MULTISPECIES: hypothetical protein [Rhizobium]SIQ20739.1 hypothetical protein SAMN05880590_102578 [Rhizobium sp. RU35A]
MQNFQRLLESPAMWFVDVMDTIRQRYRRSLSRRREADLRRRYMNG